MQTRECVGCGFCCRKAPCWVAQRVFGSVTECPALMWDEKQERWFCDLCRKPGDMGAQYRKELYVGEGCCCGLNSDRQNIPRPKRNVPINIMSRDCQILLREFGRNGMFINPDLIYLVLCGAADELGEEWKKEAIRALKENRNHIADSFQGPLIERDEECIS